MTRAHAVLHRLRRSAARFRGGEAETTSVEFVIMFPLVILLMCFAFEAGVLSTRQALLERATNLSVRELRLRPADPPSYAEMVQLICRNALIIPDCENALHIELTAVDTETWDVAPNPVACRDRDNDYTPQIVYDDAGGGDRMMLLRVCAVFRPLFPTAGLGAALAKVSESDYALVAANLFVSEPMR